MIRLSNHISNPKKSSTFGLVFSDDIKVFHSTRKNFVMELYKHSENELIIKYLTGHSDLKRDITFGIYNKNKMDIKLTKKVIELITYDLQ